MTRLTSGWDSGSVAMVGWSSYIWYHFAANEENLLCWWICYFVPSLWFYFLLDMKSFATFMFYIPENISLCSHRSLLQALCFAFSAVLFVCFGGLSSKYFLDFSIDWGVRQATSHGTGLFMQRRCNFFQLLPSQGPPFFPVMQRCVCAYLTILTKEGRDPIQFCLWHSPLVFTIFPRRAVCTLEQALSWRSGTMASAIM